MDTLSWARRGATVTGVDFSGKAVAQARRLADEVGLSRRATFLRSNLYELPTVLDARFDVVFSSWASSCGWTTSSAGPKSWRATCGPAGPSTSPSSTPCPC